MKPVRIVLADDHVLVRGGLRSLLQKLPGVEVVGETADGLEALAMLERLRPDVLLTDIAMPGLNGIETAAKAAAEFPGTRILILSMYSNEEYVIEALRAGCVGYLLKDSAVTELELALEAVGRGETYLSPSISRAVIDGFLSRGQRGDRAAYRPLTPRQREVLKLVAEGKSTKQIAALLALSVKTIETHRAQLMRRLDIHDVAGLVKYAMSSGVIPPAR